MTLAEATRIHEFVRAHARTNAGDPAIIDADGTTLSYGAVEQAISEAAKLLRDRGVVPGDRVMIVAENCAAVAVMVSAASALDAWAVPVNARMSKTELDRITGHATPRLVVCTVGVSTEARQYGEAVGAETLKTGFGEIGLAVAGPSSPEPVSEGADQVAVVLYTTGTTGQPKGVMLTHDNLRFAARTSAELRSMTPADRVYCALPLTHVFGLASVFLTCSFVGATVQLETRFKPGNLLSSLQDGVTVLPAVPQMHALLMEHTRAQGMERLEGSALHYVSSGAAPLDPAWKRKAERFYGLPLQNGYGMTESTAGICATRNPIGTDDVSVGPALPGVEVRIDFDRQDEDGVGEVLTRGPHVMKGYFRNPHETASAIGPDGFLRTGDLGRFDEDGNLHIVGRCKELIIRSGFNVYPPEVEAALNDHPMVVQSAVVGRKTEDGNEQVLAFVECADGADLDEAALKDFAAESLSGYKRPSRILIVERLPAAATGKVLKHRLLDVFSDRLDAPVSQE